MKHKIQFILSEFSAHWSQKTSSISQWIQCGETFYAKYLHLNTQNLHSFNVIPTWSFHLFHIQTDSEVVEFAQAKSMIYLIRVEPEYSDVPVQVTKDWPKAEFKPNHIEIH